MEMIAVHLLTPVLAIVAAFKLKHFLADFPFQTQFMLRKTRERDWVKPLALHCLVHAGLTFLLINVLSSSCFTLSSETTLLIAAKLAAFDFVSHFIMDRVKASPKMLGRFNDYRLKPFWLSLGLDQLIHGLSDLFVIWWWVYMATTVNL